MPRRVDRALQVAEPLNWVRAAEDAPLLFLDIEAHLDGAARRLSSPRVAAGAGPKMIVAASCLTRWPSGGAGDWSLRNFHVSKMPEADLLTSLHDIASKVLAAGGVLVTYNGEQHDLPLLRDRQSRWWQFENGAFLDYLEGRQHHIDLMRERSWGGRRPGTLGEACASYGICLMEPTGVINSRQAPREVQKADLDVVGTAALFFYVAGDRGRSTSVTRDGLTSLGTFLRKAASYTPHLRPLATNPQLGPGCQPWSKHESSSALVKARRAAILC